MTHIARTMFRCAIVVLIASLGATLAQDYELTWVTIGAGGESSGGEYDASGTSGQSDTGSAGGGSYDSSGGYWPGVIIAGDCDEDTDVDLDDFARVGYLDCLQGPGGGMDAGCGCLDFDGDTDLDLKDFAQFQEAFTGPLP